MHLLITAAVLLLSASPNALAGEMHLRVNVFVGPQNLALHVAQDKGFSAKYGLSVELQVTPNSRAQRDGLLHGAYAIAQSAVDNAVALVEVEKADVVIPAGGSDGMNELMVRHRRHDEPAVPVEAAFGAEGGIAKDARLDMAGFANTLKLRGELRGEDRNADPQKYLDLSYDRRASAGM